MTVAAAVDLADQATRRARLAALLGRLLVAEPGTDLVHLLARVPALASLASGDPMLAVDYERLLLREVPLYESVFLGPDGQRGGDVVSPVTAAYADAGFDAAGQWRVAGPDHLGVELLAYGHLCATEAAAWRDDAPDVAVRAVDGARTFLAEHLGRWGEVAMAAVARAAGHSPYASLAHAVSAFLHTEAERLRPAPEHPGLPEVVVEAPPVRLGPARLARWLLAPARCGAFLDHDDLAAAAGALGIPWRPSDARSRFREVVGDAVDGGDIATLLDGVRPAIERWHSFHAERVATRDGDRRIWREWRVRTEATLDLLGSAPRWRAAPSVSDGPVTVTVRGPDAAIRHGLVVDVVARLRSLDVVVAVSLDLDPRVTAVLRNLVAAGADDIVVEAAGVTASRGARLDAAGTDIVVRVDDTEPAPSTALVDPHDRRPLADAARKAVADLSTAGEVHS